MTPTEEQEEICREVRENKSHVMVDALAGTGKTSTLVMASRGVRGLGLALAFNKKIAEELKSRLPGNFEAKTMNALGFQALRNALPGVKNWKIDYNKVGEILTSQAKERGRGRLRGELWIGAVKLVREAQLEGLRETADEQSWFDLADKLWLDEDDQEEIVELAREALEENNLLVEKGLISFDDQIYWPIVNGAKFEKYGVILGDEAQDWNGLQHELVGRVKRERLIVAGDPRQSIYAWRGAMTNSMEELRRSHEEREWKELGLTMTWRCPRGVVTRQLGHAPRYRASQEAKEGRIERFGSFGEEKPWGVKELMELRPSEKSTMAILCRNNAPLWKLAFRLLRQRVPIVMQGADLGKMLASLSKKIEPKDGATTESFIRKLEEWEKEHIRKAKENETKVEGIADRAECLKAVAEVTRNVGEMREEIEKLFRRTTGTLTLSTIHRAKGLEWDVVMHLDDWRVPSKRALARGGEELEQEKNLKYVAETRTREVLVLASVEDFR